MMDYLPYYLLAIVDNVRELLFLITVFGTVAIAVYTLFIYIDDKKYTKTLIAAAIAVVCSGFLFALIPSSKNIALIIGAKTAVDVARSPEAKEVIEAARDRLIREINGDKKK